MTGLLWKIVWVSLLLILNLTAQSYSQRPATAESEIIVQLEDESALADLENHYAALGLQRKKCLSQRLNIWLLEYHSENMKAAAVRSLLQKNASVLQAQENHYIQRRQGDPDDPYYLDQWALHNTGQTGGDIDADIDAPEAWDITAGGFTALGDEIVIAIIDGGMDLDHPDINYWKNEAEIPANGLDDDGNGYIDDYDGWNARHSNGIIPADIHGTHVAGIAGAIGNNSEGISGVNRDVKIMPIAGASTLESVVIEAYAYIYEMRLLYNESNGAAGAFVVVSNASFGVDYADPDDFPIWCAMFDSLGSIGVLSCAATANIGVNVEAEGDMPTTCDSDYLIAVTNTTHTDRKYQSAAYGTISIDLGAPGTEILSTFPEGDYGTMTGTSMASPMVSGAISLMFAAADVTLISDYKNNPGETIHLFKDWLMEGVDSLTTLEYKTLSGGRLNLHRSIQLVQSYSDSLDPNPPINVDIYSDYVTPTSIELSWDVPPGYTSGDTLPTDLFVIDIHRDDSLIVSLPGDSLSFTDSSLVDGVFYSYTLQTRIVANDSTSSEVYRSWYAGGAPQPGVPQQLTCEGDSLSAVLNWRDPLLQADGTPLDDLDSLYVYRNDTLIAAVAAEVEKYVDVPPGGFFHDYQIAAKDSEVPANISGRSSVARCYVGVPPDFLVWVGPSAVDKSAQSGDSLWAALVANGESAILTNDLFELGEDLTVYEGIFVVLGVFGSNHVLTDQSAEALALETYLAGGGNLFVEGGDCFNFDPDKEGHNIRPWFDLEKGPDGSADVEGMIGINELSPFDFSYSGANYWMDGLVPASSVVIWQNNMNSDVLGVFSSEFGSGRSIGVVPSFGGFENSSQPINKHWRVASGKYEEAVPAVHNRPSMQRALPEPFVTKAAPGDPVRKQARLNMNRQLLDPLNPFAIHAANKNEIMAAYLNLFRAQGVPVLSVSDSIVEMNAVTNGTATRILTITNDNGSLPADLIYSVSSDPLDAWLVVPNTTDTLGRQQSNQVVLQANATGLQVGSYTSTVTITSNDSVNSHMLIPVTFTIVEAPALVLSSDSLHFASEVGGKDSLSLQVSNTGGGTLFVTIFDEDSLADSSGTKMGNSVSYRWLDSDDPEGPEFNWQDIQTGANTISLGDDDCFALALPFSFPFYDEAYDSIWISSNGYLTFDDNAKSPANDPLPDISQPQNLIAPFWDDLDPAEAANIHYMINDNELIVQYQAVSHWGGMGQPGVYTFQVILHRNGVIRFQYLDMRHTVNSASVGIENHDGSEGLQICYNEAYVHNNLAIMIEPTLHWVTVSPWELALPPDSSADITVVANSVGMLDGVFETDLVFSSNDPLSPERRLPIEFHVGYGNQPRLAIDTDTLLFDATAINSESVQTLYVHNSGNSLLEIADIISNHRAFTVDSLHRSCMPGDSIPLTVTFSPTTVGEIEAALNITSNDTSIGVANVVLIGVGELATGISSDELPSTFALAPNFPNPFNPTTTLSWQLPQSAQVSIIIYNMLGQVVRQLVSGVHTPGTYKNTWDGRDAAGNSVASGVYIYQMAAFSQTGNEIFFTKSRKMMLVK